MCLTIDIFKGEVMNFPGIPLNKVERKKSQIFFYVELLNKFTDYNLLRVLIRYPRNYAISNLLVGKLHHPT